MLQEYQRKKHHPVTAVQLDLDTEGFTYRKWEGMQRCKRGDWLVNSGNDTYTVDAASFDRTYRIVTPGGPGVYEKIKHVWAKQAEQAGSIQTKEGFTTYDAGDFLVFNDPAGKDGYAMKSDTFHSLYEPLAK